MRKNLEEKKYFLFLQTLTLIDGNIKNSSLLCINTQTFTLHSTQHQLPVKIVFSLFFLVALNVCTALVIH